jgi:hypothetical protein
VATSKDSNRVRQVTLNARFENLSHPDTGARISRAFADLQDAINLDRNIAGLPSPTGLTATPKELAIYLQWDELSASFRGSWDGARIWRATVSQDANLDYDLNTKKSVIVSLIRSTNYLDDVGTDSESYIYWVEWINLDGIASGPSAGVKATALASSSAGLPVDTVVPQAPTIGVKKSGVFSVILGVEKPSGSPTGWTNVTSIILEVSSDSGFSSIVYTGTNSGAMMYSALFTFISEGAGHFYSRARAANDAGTGSNSATLQFDCDETAGDTDVPSAPTVTLSAGTDAVSIRRGGIRARIDWSGCTNRAGLWGAWLQINSTSSMTNPESSPVYSNGNNKGTIVTGGYTFVDATADFVAGGVQAGHVIMCTYESTWPGSPATRVFLAGVSAVVGANTLSIVGGCWSQASGQYCYRIVKPLDDATMGLGGGSLIWAQSMYQQSVIDRGFSDAYFDVEPGTDYYVRGWLFNLFGRSPASAVAGPKQSAAIASTSTLLDSTTRGAVVSANAGLASNGDVNRTVPNTRLDGGLQSYITTGAPNGTFTDIWPYWIEYTSGGEPILDSKSARFTIYWKYTDSTNPATQFLIEVSDGTAFYIWRVKDLANAGAAYHKFTVTRVQKDKTYTVSITPEFAGKNTIAAGSKQTNKWTILPNVNENSDYGGTSVGSVDWAGGGVWFDTYQYRNSLPPANGYTDTSLSISSAGTESANQRTITLLNLAYTQGSPYLATHLAVFIKAGGGTISLTSDSIVTLLNLASLPSSYTIPYPLNSRLEYAVGIAACALTAGGYAFHATFKQYTLTADSNFVITSAANMSMQADYANNKTLTLDGKPIYIGYNANPAIYLTCNPMYVSGPVDLVTNSAPLKLKHVSYAGWPVYTQLVDGETCIWTYTGTGKRIYTRYGTDLYYNDMTLV